MSAVENGTKKQELKFGDLHGQVALVTGGGAGIGFESIRLLASAGADIALIDRDPAACERVRAEVESFGRRAQAIELDLMEIDKIGGAVQEVVDQLGRIDILIQLAYLDGARLGKSEKLLEVEQATWESVFVVNVEAPLFMMQHVGQHMIDRGGGGRIVNVTSSSAFRAQSHIVYGSSKAALNQMTRTVAAQLGPHGITVNNVAPGRTMTQPAIELFGEETLARDAREGSRANLLGRFARPEEVAAAVFFLCLPEARAITAETIHTTAGSGL